jgi:putative transposase
MMYPLVLDLADDSMPVAVTCWVLGFTTQAFYKWRKNPVTQRDWDDAHLINAAMGIHADDPTFGYRFIADELAAAGIGSGRSTPRDAAEAEKPAHRCTTTTRSGCSSRPRRIWSG